MDVCFYIFNPCVNFEEKGRILIVCVWRDSPKWARASSYTRFLDRTQRRTSVVRTPLDERSTRRAHTHTHKPLTTDKRPWPLWGSNPQFQQASGLRLRPRGHWDRPNSNCAPLFSLLASNSTPTNVLNQRLSNNVLRHIDVLRVEAKWVAGKRKVHSASHYPNTNTVALSIVERYNFKLAFGGKGRSWLLVYAFHGQLKYRIGPKATWYKGNLLML